MSKLAHSNQETMDEIERKRAIENGDEDCLPLVPFVDVQHETAYGVTVRLPFVIRVF